MGERSHHMIFDCCHADSKLPGDFAIAQFLDPVDQENLPCALAERRKSLFIAMKKIPSLEVKHLIWSDDGQLSLLKRNPHGGVAYFTTPSAIKEQVTGDALQPSSRIAQLRHAIVTGKTHENLLHHVVRILPIRYAIAEEPPESRGRIAIKLLDRRGRLIFGWAGAWIDNRRYPVVISTADHEHAARPTKAVRFQR